MCIRDREGRTTTSAFTLGVHHADVIKITEAARMQVKVRLLTLRRVGRGLCSGLLLIHDVLKIRK